MSENKKGLALLREKFPSNLVSQKPQGTKAQNDCPPSEKVNCKVCGGWHHPKVQHLAYVGHAALTDRLLDADPEWNWEPMALDADGLPKFDQSGGLWIKLTVCGVTRLGYGHAQASNFKEIGAREKEVIGDALRNAAMRFGAALDFWSKADLHGDECDHKKPEQEQRKQEKPALEYYSEEEFATKAHGDKGWYNLVESGKYTAEKLINTIQSKGKLFTEQQIEIINSWQDLANEKTH